MTTASLCVSIRFLDGRFHGQGDGGRPEWPPSPLRLFQALVATATTLARNHDGDREDEGLAALRWLESLPPPAIHAPAQREGAPYRLSVPNNAMDIVARAWVRGNTSGTGDADPRTHRAMKTIRPTHLIEGDSVHYLWSLRGESSAEWNAIAQTLRRLAHHLVTVGWGMDFVAADVHLIDQEHIETLPGRRWTVALASDTTLRVPVSGTLSALTERHASFLRRFGDQGFRPVPPLPNTAYAMTGYRQETESRQIPFAAFQILKPDASGFRPFSPNRGYVVAGMLRHLARTAAEDSGRSADWIARFVLGHGESLGESTHSPVGADRFAYLPLPSLESRGPDKSRVVGGIRRALLATFTEAGAAEIAWTRRMLPGRDLIDEHTSEVKALLALMPTSDRTIQSYVKPCSQWATVTPLILPGHDDHNSRKAESLLRKAIIQAGFSPELARHAELEWRAVGFWPGLDLAIQYFVPEHLRSYPRFHARISWRDPNHNPVAIAGPICVGGGRYHGLGLFAALE